MTDAAVGARERRRRRRAVPSVVSRDVAGVGCLAVAAAWIAGCLVAYGLTEWDGWLALAVPAALVVVVGLGRRLYGRVLIVAVRVTLVRRGIRCLVVYSESPNWHAYIQSNWLARMGPAAVTLNWSERASWRRTLEVRLFRHFVADTVDFNPAVVVFRGVRRPLVFRFFQAFREDRAGRPKYLARQEEQLFRALAL